MLAGSISRLKFRCLTSVVLCSPCHSLPQTEEHTTLTKYHTHFHTHLYTQSHTSIVLLPWCNHKLTHTHLYTHTHAHTLSLSLSHTHTLSLCSLTDHTLIKLCAAPVSPAAAAAPSTTPATFSALVPLLPPDALLDPGFVLPEGRPNRWLALSAPFHAVRYPNGSGNTVLSSSTLLVHEREKALLQYLLALQQLLAADTASTAAAAAAATARLLTPAAQRLGASVLGAAWNSSCTAAGSGTARCPVFEAYNLGASGVGIREWAPMPTSGHTLLVSIA